LTVSEKPTREYLPKPSLRGVSALGRAKTIAGEAVILKTSRNDLKLLNENDTAGKGMGG